MFLGEIAGFDLQIEAQPCTLKRKTPSILLARLRIRTVLPWAASVLAVVQRSRFRCGTSGFDRLQGHAPLERRLPNHLASSHRGSSLTAVFTGLILPFSPPLDCPAFGAHFHLDVNPVLAAGSGPGPAHR